MLIECLREAAIYLGIAIGIPCVIFGLFRFWQVFAAPRFRRVKRRDRP